MLIVQIYVSWMFQIKPGISKLNKEKKNLGVSGFLQLQGKNKMLDLSRSLLFQCEITYDSYSVFTYSINVPL